MGLPSGPGIGSFADVGALVPMIGAGAISTGGGGGVAHEFHDFGIERFTNGFANGKSSFAFGSFGFEGFDSKVGALKAFDGIPAFLSAILVVSFANIVIVKCWEKMDGLTVVEKSFLL